MSTTPRPAAPRQAGVITRTVVALLAAVVALIGGATPLLAHGQRTVGPFVFRVGFLHEPAYVNEINAVELRVTRSAGGEPVLGAHLTLRLEVQQGPAKKDLELFGVPAIAGNYTADLLRTVAGEYRFRFYGELEGQKIDEVFVSGPGSFDPVIEPTAIEFPVPRLVASNGNSGIDQLARRLLGLETQLRQAEQSAELARSLAIGGLILGALGLAYGVLMHRRTERKP